MNSLMNTISAFFSVVLIGYIIGNISPSFLIGWLKGYDVRSSGSGNAGASNTVIMAGKAAGLLVAILDIFKAWVSWKLAEFLLPGTAFAGAAAGVGCTFGHMYPVVLKFKGGRGFACLGGIVLAYSGKVFFLMLGIAVFLAVLINYIAIVCCMMWTIYPVSYGFMTGQWGVSILLLIPLPFVLLRHGENFRRIREGKELRVSYLFQKERELERTGYKEN